MLQVCQVWHPGLGQNEMKSFAWTEQIFNSFEIAASNEEPNSNQSQNVGTYTRTQTQVMRQLEHFHWKKGAEEQREDDDRAQTVQTQTKQGMIRTKWFVWIKSVMDCAWSYRENKDADDQKGYTSGGFDVFSMCFLWVYFWMWVWMNVRVCV